MAPQQLSLPVGIFLPSVICSQNFTHTQVTKDTPCKNICICIIPYINTLYYLYVYMSIYSLTSCCLLVLIVV